MPPIKINVTLRIQFDKLILGTPTGLVCSACSVLISDSYADYTVQFVNNQKTFVIANRINFRVNDTTSANVRISELIDVMRHLEWKWRVRYCRIMLNLDRKR